MSMLFLCSASPVLPNDKQTPKQSAEMANVEKDIKETSSKIDEVRRIVKKRVEDLEYKDFSQTPISTGVSWKDLNFSQPQNTIRLGTLFSGIGAIEHAFQRLGLKHQIVFAGDIEPKCKQSYFANYQINEEDWFSDIRDFDAKKYKGQVDFIVGGAPCQAFSMVGHRLGFEDARGTLFYEFARVVKETQPKVFLFENVRGLLNHDKGRTWHVMHDIFEELGYDVKFRVLNSCDYGIPQHRERVYCLGFKNKTDFQFPAPIPLEYRMYDFLEDYIDTKYFLREKGVKFVTSHKNKEKFYTQINGDIQLCQKRNQQFNWHGDFVYHPQAIGETAEEDFDEFIFDVREVEEKYYLSEKSSKVRSVPWYKKL